jgi:hypothetical protein|uniref:Uncharacterized protein n=1 Tax=Rubrivivax gelatinosus S1 TaxID=1138313 RepID=L8BAH3_RUBGE|nr:exported hypothetical protein [Rubrivivax gelatinosus S1]
MMRTLHASATTALLALGLTTSAMAGPAPYEPTAAELAALPPACQVKIGPEGRRDLVQQDLWRNRLGADNWMHYHHYCHGIKFTNRAFATFDRALKRYYLQSAVGEFNYVLNAWPANSSLRPEAERRKQLVQNLMQAK